MGSSTKKKQTRQPFKLLKAGGSPLGGGKTKNSTELLVPLVNIRPKPFARLKGGEPVHVRDLISQLDVMLSGVVLGEIAPHFELLVRQFDFKRGVVHSIDRDASAVTIRFSS